MNTNSGGINYGPVTEDYFNLGPSQSFNYGQNGGWYNSTYSTSYHTREAIFYLPENADSVEITFFGNTITNFSYMNENEYFSPSQSSWFTAVNHNVTFDLVIWR